MFDALDKWDPPKIDYKYSDRETNPTEVLDTKLDIRPIPRPGSSIMRRNAPQL